jgi:hypothetical protein
MLCELVITNLDDVTVGLPIVSYFVKLTDEPNLLKADPPRSEVPNPD